MTFIQVLLALIFVGMGVHYLGRDETATAGFLYIALAGLIATFSLAGAI